MPFAAQLPPLPAPGSAHQADAAIFTGNNGNMFYAKSDNAFVTDQQLTLDSDQGTLSWAIYDFSSIRFDLADSTLLLDPEADGPGTLYLAFSNYASLSWQFQQVGVDTGSNYLELPIPKDSPFVDIDPELEVGVSYLALMTWDGMDVTLKAIDIAMGVVNAPPANLVASDGTSAQWIHLGWDHVDYARGYLIEYKPSDAGDEGWVELYGAPGIPNNEAVHLFTGTSPDDPEYGVSYDYRVRTYFYDNDISDYSNVDSGYRAFPAPQNLSATYNVHIGKVELAWDEVPAAAAYEIFRRHYLDPEFAYLDLALEPHYLDESLPDSDVYEYKVFAYDTEHNGPFSEVAQGSALDFSFHDWQTFHDLRPDIRMMQISGKICAAYFNTRFDDIYFAQANTLYPNNISSWTHFPLGRGVNSGELSLGLLDGKPAISARYSASNHLTFIYADKPVPLSIPVWTATTIDESGSAAGRPTWIETGGVPLVAFHTDPEGADTEGLYVYRATSALPLTQSDWLGYQLEEGHAAGDTASLALVDGVPAIVSNAASYTDFYYRYADTALPTSASNWTTTRAPGGSVTSRAIEMVLLNDLPFFAMSEYIYAETEFWGISAYGVEENPPTGTGSWASGSYIVNMPDDWGQSLDVAVVNDRPAICFYDETYGDLKLAISRTEIPTQDSWVVNTVASEGDVGSACALMDYRGYPVLLYYDATAQKIIFAQGE